MESRLSKKDMCEDFSFQLSLVLSAYRRRALVHLFIRGFSWLFLFLIVFLAVLIILMGWWGGFAMRVSGWITFFTGLIAMTIFLIVLPFGRLKTPWGIADIIGKNFPHLWSGIFSAQEFLLKSREKSEFSSFLINEHYRKIDSELSMINEADAIPFKRVIPSVISLFLGIGAVWGVGVANRDLFYNGLDGLFFDREIYFLKAQEPVRTPVVNDLRVRLRFPEYLKKEEQVLSSFSGGFEAPLGTAVYLDGLSAIEGAVSGHILLSSGDEHELRIDKNGRIYGNFLIEDIEWFSLFIENSKSIYQGPKRRVEVAEDQRPQIRLLRPVRAVEMDVNQGLQIEFEAFDDHGIDRVELLIRSGSELDTSRTVIHCAPKVTHLRHTFSWSPETIRLDHIDTLELSLRVFDDDTIKGPKFSNSESIEVRVITQASKAREQVQKQSDILDSLVDLLGARLESSVLASYEKADEIRERFFKLQGTTRDLLGQINRFIAQLPTDKAISEGLKNSYARIREDISRQILFEARLNELPLASYKQRASADVVTVRLLERAIIHVDDLILDNQFYEFSMDGLSLESHRESLAGLLDVYNKTRQERSRRKVLDSIDQMERAAMRLSEKMKDVKGHVSPGFLVDSTQNILDLGAEFARLRRLLAQGDVSLALKMVQELEDTIKELLANIESGHLAYKTERFGKQDEFIGRLVQRVSALESDQLQQRRMLVAFYRKYREKLMNMMKNDMGPLIKRGLVTINKIKKSFDGLVEDNSLTKHGSFVFEMRSMFENAEEMLREGDLDLVLQMLEVLDERVKNLSSSSMQHSDKNILQIIEMISKLQKDIKDAFPVSRKVLDNAERNVLRKYAGNQRRMAADTRKLSSWIRKEQQDFKYIGEQAREILDVVSSNMAESSSSLEKNKIAQAINSSTVALDNLIKLKEIMKSGQRSVLVRSTPVQTDSRVLIPSIEDHTVPKEYRDDILKAMREKMPTQYAEAIGKYYETLVY